MLSSHDAIRRWLAQRPLGDISVTLVENPDYHKANGVSALAARELLKNPFLLLMADHIFEPKTAQALLQQTLKDDEVILGVDYNIDRIFDLEDATKVKVQGDDIIDIGKDLVRYDALDTGMFLCGPSLFERLVKFRHLCGQRFAFLQSWRAPDCLLIWSGTPDPANSGTTS